MIAVGAWGIVHDCSEFSCQQKKRAKAQHRSGGSSRSRELGNSHSPRVTDRRDGENRLKSRKDQRGLVLSFLDFHLKPSFFCVCELSTTNRHRDNCHIIARVSTSVHLYQFLGKHSSKAKVSSHATKLRPIGRPWCLF